MTFESKLDQISQKTIIYVIYEVNEVSHTLVIYLVHIRNNMWFVKFYIHIYTHHNYTMHIRAS